MFWLENSDPNSSPTLQWKISHYVAFICIFSTSSYKNHLRCIVISMLCQIRSSWEILKDF